MPTGQDRQNRGGGSFTLAAKSNWPASHAMRHFAQTRKQESAMAGRNHRDIFADDIEWAEGGSPGIRYARFLFDEDDASSPLMILSKFEPGEVVEPHTHGANYAEYVIAGEQTVGKTTFRAGDIRLAKAGAGYGPILIGPEGCTVLIVFQHATGAMTLPVGKARQAEGV
jgi:anti-sigma factor ChrR (cupin superfamily)